MALLKEPVVKLREILLANWNQANTDFHDTPVIVTGWVENDDWAKPHVCLVFPDESPMSSGNTGFTGQSSIGRPSRRMLGRILVTCMTHEDMADIGNSPKSIAWQMSEEVKRIMDENYYEPGDGINWITFVGRRGVTDSVRRPLIFRQDCDITYSYDERL